MPHVFEHDAQLRFVPSCASHPFTGSPSQSAHPAVHDGTHTPLPEQVVVPCAFVHAVPQDPQLVRVVALVSHPFSGLPSQFPHPVLHDGVHRPRVQFVGPCALVHAVPHVPQWLTFV